MSGVHVNETGAYATVRRIAANDASISVHTTPLINTHNASHHEADIAQQIICDCCCCCVDLLSPHRIVHQSNYNIVQPNGRSHALVLLLVLFVLACLYYAFIVLFAMRVRLNTVPPIL